MRLINVRGINERSRKMSDEINYDEELIYEGATVWFTDPDNELSSGLYTVDRICGEVYSLSNDDGSVEAYKHELEVRYV
tara:strand:- start:1277 stop:1513 length:237 start_codon:yes stop_codon:yes gene_type:complete